MGSIFDHQTKSLEQQYFDKVRPELYINYGHKHQTGVRKGTTLAEHLDSACQFILTTSKIAEIPEHLRGLLLAATAVHDLNKLDPEHRKVQLLARDQEFLKERLAQVFVDIFVKNDEDLELIRKLIERHSGHNVTDGAIFLPEEPIVKRLAALLTAADLFDLGIALNERFAKVAKELTVAFGRKSQLFCIGLSRDQGYLTALLLGACEEILHDNGLNLLAIFPDHTIFEGNSWPAIDLVKLIAMKWQEKIEQVFGNNINLLVNATKDGIKISNQAMGQDQTEILDNIVALLEKKKAGFKADKVAKDVQKWSEEAGIDAVNQASKLGLLPVSNAEEFAIAEGLKATYLSYRQANVTPQEAWDRIADHVHISPAQRIALEAFNGQYGRPLFAGKVVNQDLAGIKAALLESFELRKKLTETGEFSEVSPEIILAVSRSLNLPIAVKVSDFNDLNNYIESNPRKRCSLGSTAGETDDLIADNMPIGTKVQVFSNRLPGGIVAEPKRQAETMTALSYQLMAVGANLPSTKKAPPYYLHLTLPKNSSPELLKIWQDFLEEKASSSDGGPMNVDEVKLYRDHKIEFKPNKVVGLALPKRPNFIYNSTVIPITWGDVNSSLALLKSLGLGLELSLLPELGFPLCLSGNLEIEVSTDFFARVEGIPSSLQSLLGTGQYDREKAEKIRDQLRCLRQLAINIASLAKADDCLYDLARAIVRPFTLYFVIFRWVLREQEEPNLSVVWSKICQPLTNLLESFMSEENNLLTKYLRELAQVAVEGKIWGSSFKRTAQSEPFTAFISAIRSQKPYMDSDLIFANLVQQYHTRLDRIREHGVGQTKYEQVKKYYEVLRQLYEQVYHGRADKLLSDRKTLEAAYLFFLEEARQQNKASDANTETN